jgi:hypothetical protein
MKRRAILPEAPLEGQGRPFSALSPPRPAQPGSAVHRRAVQVPFADGHLRTRLRHHLVHRLLHQLLADLVVHLGIAGRRDQPALDDLDDVPAELVMDRLARGLSRPRRERHVGKARPHLLAAEKARVAAGNAARVARRPTMARRQKFRPIGCSQVGISAPSRGIKAGGRLAAGSRSKRRGGPSKEGICSRSAAGWFGGGAQRSSGMMARDRMRRIGLVCLCLVLAGCGGNTRGHGPGPSALLPPPVENSPNMVRLMGGNADVARLHPEPGDIWAGIVPTEPPEALTPFTPVASGTRTARAAPVAAPASVGHAATAPRPSVAAPPSVATLPSVAALPPKPVRHAPAFAPASRATTGPMAVQLAAAGSAQSAVQVWKALQKRLPGLVRGHPPEVSSAEVDGRTVWRLRAKGFATIAEANAFCASVREAKSACWVVGRSAEP